MSEANDDRQKRIEAKLEEISKQITDLKLDIMKRESEIETRIELLEDWKKRAEQGPRTTYFKWALVASWVSILITAVALIFK